MSCPEGVGKADKLSHSHKDQLQPMGNVDEDQVGGTVDLGNAEFQVDRMALDTIYSAMPPEMVTMLMMKDTTMEAWESNKMT
jgi:hypothetical protein